MRVSKFIIAAGVALGLMASTAAASTIVIDFEDFAAGFYGPDADLGGVSFQSPNPDQQFQVGAFRALGPGQSGNAGRMSIPDFGAAPRGGSFGGTFIGSTVSFISVIAGDGGNPGDTDIFNLQGFDVDGNLVAETGSVESQEATLLSISGAGIATFFLSIGDRPDNGGSSVIDNFTFTRELAPVPLPASLPLLGFGLVAMGAVARRRRRNAT